MHLLKLARSAARAVRTDNPSARVELRLRIEPDPSEEDAEPAEQRKLTWRLGVAASPGARAQDVLSIDTDPQLDILERRPLGIGAVALRAVEL